MCHIIVNSRKHIPRLLEAPNFSKLFNWILKKCHSDEEAKHFWERYSFFKGESGGQPNVTDQRNQYYKGVFGLNKMARPILMSRHQELPDRWYSGSHKGVELAPGCLGIPRWGWTSQLPEKVV